VEDLGGDADGACHLARHVPQDVCPGRLVENLGLAADALVFDLIVDTLDSEGPEAPGRIDRPVCPGSSRPKPTPTPSCR